MKLELPLANMTVAEKLEAIECIWNDLRRSCESVPSPHWHEEVLRQREAEIEAGTAEFFTLDEVKERLRLRRQ